MRINKKYIYIPLAVVVIALVFGAGFFVGKKSVPQSALHDRIFFNKELGKPEVVDFSLFWEALSKLEDEYVDANKIDYQQMLYGAISGMTESLGDDYTVFMKPEKTDSFIQSVSGNDSFEGVGMELGLKSKVLTVVAPIEGTPAYNAGIKAGDKILKIDDKSTEGMQVEEAVNLIRGEKGTQVKLSIIRKNLDQPKEFIVTRDVIQVPVIRWEMEEGNIAYIKIYQFASNLPSKFEDVVSEILKNNASRIVIDLRNNPGGYLEVANEIASWFLPKGAVVVREEFRDGESNEYKSKGYKHLQNFPVTILVNGGSASASEILAGALRDQKGVKLIGEKTFGKGSVQTLEEFSDGSSLKITVAKWFTPNGTSIADEGLKPDIEVELTQEDIDNDRDSQLDKAMEVIKSL
ncbi:MAG: S41 family peptidase [Candidatus Portnoybacteria bacterium CG10_big_fil_rev_8_21_14_0_10_38_18]|uniref:S41 family peptidase n=1 Tax=Candidatus Portnoybacteria bacterium CG10_big_fil_rev_8_21_14_0_10_38_18 TaxID=1974813 RepID=A0A2M8KCN9_9BACT|nr:MAG: S41 family peptidase [Candidatus Portnoybacteria bacterium CG10_big_fil_rev_8_21_14_0_10_38_18]